MPDPVAVVLAVLRAALPGVRCGTRRPDNLAAHAPFVRVQRIGGTPAWPTWRPGPVLDRAGVALTIWGGPDPADARRLAYTALAALAAAAGTRTPSGVLVRVAVLTGPTDLPDPDEPIGLHRFVTTVQALVR
jgi:hypothetical protein